MKNIFKVGVTGHRDLKKNSLIYYKKQVYSLLVNLKRKHTHLIIYSPLSDGADRLIVKEGIKLDIPFVVIMPMSKDKYISDFDSSSLKEFNTLVSQAQEIITTPNCPNKRDLQYEFCGHYIADNCDSLIALWDGRYIGLIGGTGEIVKYYLEQKYNNLYHIYVSRDKK